MAGELAGAGLSLAAAACWGAADFNGGIGTKGANPFGVVVIAHGVGLVCMLTAALIVGEAVPSHRALAFGAAAGVAGGLGLAALYRSLSVGKMGINAPVAAVLTAALPVVYSFRSEGWPSWIQFCGIRDCAGKHMVDRHAFGRNWTSARIGNRSAGGDRVQRISGAE